MEEKRLLVIDLKEEMALVIEKIEHLLLNLDLIVEKVLQKKVSQTFLRNEKKVVVFTIERKLVLKNLKVNNEYRTLFRSSTRHYSGHCLIFFEA